MFVRQWMTSPVIVVPPETPVPVALRIMQDRGIRRLPVVEDGRLVGIATREDLRAVVSRRLVRDVMSPRPATVPPDETLERAAQIMLRRKVSGLPVVEGARVVGIITESDVFRALATITGMNGTGARLVLSVPEGEDLLGALTAKLRGRPIRSLVTWLDERLGLWHAVVRIGARRPVAVKPSAE